MSFSNEHIGGGADGGIFNMYVELPSWVTHEDVGLAMVQIDSSVQLVHESPVARVFSEYLEPQQADIEDYRRFYVEFDPEAAAEDIRSAVEIVANAIKSMRYKTA